MNRRSDALVLKTREYGDADLIVTFFARELGIVHGFAKSARKFRSRFGASLEPLSHVRLSLMGKEGASLPRITQADIIDSLCYVRENLQLLLHVAPLADLITGMLHEHEPHPRKFDLFLAALRSFETGAPRELVALAFRVKFLWMTGYAPRTGGCGRCGAAFQGSFALFYPAQGTVLCRSCAPAGEAEAVKLSAAAVKLLETLKGRRFDELAAMPVSGDALAEAGRVIDAHVKRHG
jgi:DNA repair protein RecO (recombination protein O)